jgi:hypothetical protein
MWQSICTCKHEALSSNPKPQSHTKKKVIIKYCFVVFFLEILGCELRAYTLRHSTSPFFVMGFFKIGS